MLKWLIVSMVVCLTPMKADARPIIKLLEDHGEVVGSGTCTMAKTRFDCVQVAYEGNLYSVLGTINGDDFHALYVAKKIGEEWMLVWSWKGEA